MCRAITKFLILLTVIVLVDASPSVAEHPFTLWEDEVFVAIGEEHGPEAEKRMRRIMEIILANHDKPVMEKLKLTNDSLNNVPWIADPELWKREDYWATPFETLTTFGGDCEDMAI